MSEPNLEGLLAASIAMVKRQKETMTNTNMMNPVTANEQASTPAPGLLDRIVEEQAKQKAAVASRYQPVMSINEMVEREKQIQYLVDNILVEGVDYGWMPGTKPGKTANPGEYQPKPSLFKAGSERVCAFFGYSPEYRLDEVIEAWTPAEYGEPLFYYRYCCTLKKDMAAVGQGIGSGSTWESKYRYRKSDRTCPECNASGTIIKGREEFGGGWICYKPKGGCGAKFKDGAAAIEDQKAVRVPNPDVADVVNTVQKMALKRSYVAATLSATGLSARFTQDLEDLPLPPAAEQVPVAAAEPVAKPVPVPDALAADVEEFKREFTKADRFGRLKTFGLMKQQYQKLAGSTIPYYGRLRGYGVEHSNEFKVLSRALACAKEMFVELMTLENTQNPYEEDLAGLKADGVEK